MSDLVSLPPHPVLACADALERVLAEVADVAPVFMTPDAKEAALVALAARAAQLDELRLRVLAAADDVAETHGSRDAGAWLSHRVRLDDRVGRHDLATARSLERHPVVATALRRGAIDRARAEVVMRAVDALPDSVGADVIDRAETLLTSEAAEFNPGRLRNLGRRVLAVVAPELDEAHEARLLEQEDAHAAAVTALHTHRRGDGATDIRIRCADAVADRLLTYLHALVSPRRPDEGGTPPADTGADDRRTYPQRLGHAFGTFLEQVDPTRLPLHGGDATTVIVTIDLATLLSGLGVALVGDQPITAAQARRLACQAHLVPAVLGGESQVLDLGRGQRLFQRHQRKAMAIRDVTCRADGCTIPAAWCEAHHWKPWSRGGATDLDDGVLLCSHHHHRAHDHRYDSTRHADGSVRFHRRV